MTLHLFLLVGIVGCSSFLGFYQSRRLSSRVTFLEECLLLLQKMRAYLSHERITTAQLVHELARVNSLATLTFLADCDQRLKAGEIFPVAWGSALDGSSQHDPLLEEDRTVLRMIGEILGSSPAAVQQGELSVVEQLLQQQRTHAQTQCLEKGKLYRSLGVLCGIGIAILMG